MAAPSIANPAPASPMQAPGRAATAARKPADDRPTFIRATEIWVPTTDRRQLELAAGLYGPLNDFELVSRQTRFDRDEGLPGKAWAAGHPIVLKDLGGSYFKRGGAAQAAGLTCGVALPIFAGPILMAVMVLLCGDDREHVGAIEVWHAPADSLELGLVDGYFGTANVFEWSSRHTKFPRGAGLPGMVWESGMPLILEDLGLSRRFLRWESAQRAGINRGVAIPCGKAEAGVWVLSFLSALDSPIARRFEAWVPDGARDGLVFDSGYCEEAAGLGETYAGRVLAVDRGSIGQVWRSGVPAISTELAAEPAPIAGSTHGTSLSSMVAMPVIADGAPRAVVAWYL